MLPKQIVEWNRTFKDYPLDRPVHHLLEEQAARTPDLPAVRFAGTELSYRELHRRINRVARHLVSHGVGRDALVGVYMERSIEMVVALLAIVKAGGAYVPLDPEYPSDRLTYMFADSGVRTVLTQRHLPTAIVPADVEQLYLDDAVWAATDASDDVAPANEATPDSAVYMIYTSGSTGRPKGVVNIHKGLVNRIIWMQEAFPLTSADRVLQKTPYSFDVSVWEFFWPLMTGACIVVAKPGGHRDSDYLVDLIEEEHVTTLHFVPSMLGLFLTSERLDRAKCLRQVMSSGEALPAELVRKFYSVFGSEIRLHNLYGPTEAAIDVTHWACLPDATKNVVPIGYPIANIQTYILDESLKPVPIGDEGELYLGGVGLARGYWNQPELTAERFVPNPFGDGKNDRLYKTGDLARYLPDGAIEYLGRLDFQVKLRGFRIELGEIEAVILQHDLVQAVVVVATEESLADRQLIAYVVPSKEQRPTVDALRGHLGASLPEYMVPARFIFLDEMPLLPNGKVDRKQLPRPQAQQRPELSEMLVAPRTDRERLIAGVWVNLLGISEVGVRDNFFELGGNSLRAVQMAAELKRALQRDLPVVKVFQYPTIERLAGWLDGEDSGASDLTAARQRGARSQRGSASDGERTYSGDVAVIGMVGRFPGAKNMEELWTNLCNGVESITRFTPEELAEVDEEIRNHPDYVPTRGIIEGADRFDARFFGIGPLEAKLMDPQQRIFLELCWGAIENAGYDSERFAGPIGVYAGVGDNHYYTNNVLGHPDLVRTVGKLIVGYGNEKDYIATRVSYSLNLTGPSVSANTGCSTSLLAVDGAVRSLRDHECDMALAGGVDIFVPQRSGQIFKEGGTFTKDGHCRPFDSEATGTMFCDGAGVVVLRRLEDALADGDHVYAVIKGIAKNNDGANKVSFLAPSVEGQVAVISIAQAQAGISADTIGYAEAHGTGTPLGDPIEVEALTRAFRATTERTGYCRLGSIKGNIGHPTIASGIAGLMKACLVLDREFIPATINFRKPNTRIDFVKSPFTVVHEATPWPRGAQPRRACVSSFGFGGTNVHAVLEEGPVDPRRGGIARPVQLLPISAKSEGSLKRIQLEFADYLSKHPDADLADFAYTLQVGRRHFALRHFLVSGSVTSAQAALAQATDGQFQRVSNLHPEVVFAFPGQGSQYIQMGKALYETEAVYRHWVDHCAELLLKPLGRDLREVLFPAPGQEEAATEVLKNTRFTQPALFTVEYALAQYWMSLGVQPSVVVGHSIAEFVCACLAGVFTLSDALHLVALRGKLMSELPRGSMLSVRLPAADVVGRLPDNIQLAATNAPTLCVVAGPTEAVAALASTLEAEGVTARLLQTSHAFHSAMMTPIVDTFVAAVAAVPRAPAQLRILSTCRADWVGANDWMEPSYWGDQLRMPVLFSDSAAKLLEEPSRVILEVGPREVLSSLTRQQAQGEQRSRIISTLGATAGDQLELEAVLRAVGSLWVNGVDLQWEALHSGETRRRQVLPTYAFEPAKHWVSPVKLGVVGGASAADFESNAGDDGDASTDAAGTAGGAPKTLLEQIYRLMAVVTGVQANPQHSDRTFIEQGFDSLSLTQLEVVLHKEFGVTVTWRQLIEEHSTPLKLEAFVQANGKLPQAQGPATPGASTGLTLLRAGGSRNLYLAYDGEGDIMQYLKLARSLPQDFTIYGITPLRQNGMPQVHTTVEEMAQHVVGVMRRSQAEGPYLLGGLCAGGVIAFEAAYQLEQAGQKVEKVILLDAINPTTPTYRWRVAKKRWNRFVSKLTGKPLNEPPPPVYPGAAEAPVSAVTPPAELPPGVLGALMKARNLVNYEVGHQLEPAWIRGRIQLQKQVLARGQEWPKWLPPLKEIEIYMTVKDDYSPGVIDADVLLVRAQLLVTEGVDAPAKTFVPDPLYGWASRTRGKLTTIDSVGGHVSMLLDAPWYVDLANDLARALGCPTA